MTNQVWLVFTVSETDKYMDSSFPVLLFCCRDRLRTTTNVLGDSIGAGIIEFLSKDELQSGDVELGSSVLEENEVKKPYQMIPQENDYENEKPPRDSETKM